MKRFGGALIVPLAAALLALVVYTAFFERPVARAQETVNGTWGAVRLESYPQEDVQYVLLISPQGKMEVVRWDHNIVSAAGAKNAVSIIATFDQPTTATQ